MTVRSFVLALLMAHGASLSRGAAAALAQSGAPKTVTGICLAPAAVESAPSGVDPVSAVQTAFTSFLTGPTLAVQPLTARLQSQVREEARLNGCAFLLLPGVKHERKTGGGGLFGKVAGGAVQQGAWSVSGATGSAVGRAVAGAAAGAASSAVNDYAAGSRVKDELTLSYRLESSAGAVLLESSEKRKAKSDGEDLLAPLVQRAAERVAAAASKAR